MLPGGTALDFPDDMPQESIQQAMGQFFELNPGAMPKEMQAPPTAGPPIGGQHHSYPSEMLLPLPGEAEYGADGNFMSPSPAAQRKVLGRSWLPNLEAGLSQAGLGLTSLASRATGIGDADQLNREADTLGSAADQVSQQDQIPDFLQRGVRGVSASVPPMLVGLLGTGGNPAGAIGMAMASEANSAITTGRDEGLTGKKLAGYVAVKGGIEGGIAAAFQMAGMGGAENMLRPIAAGTAKELTRQGIKSGLKEFARNSGHELREEVATELSHLLADRAFLDSKTEITPAEVGTTVLDTVTATMMTMGLLEGAGAGVRAIDRAANQKDKKDGEDTNEYVPPPATDDVSTPPPPAADGEESNVAQDSGEEVIPDAVRQEEGRMQGGTEGQVAPPPLPPPVSTEAATDSAPTGDGSVAMPSGFTTAQGSTYAVDEAGRTTRTKSPHALHDPNDVGTKPTSELTLYIDENNAREVGMWNTLSNDGKRVIIQDGEVLLTSVNPSTGARGVDAKFPFLSSPSVGLSPLELWDGNSNDWYKGNHPGSAITSINESPLSAAPAVVSDVGAPDSVAVEGQIETPGVNVSSPSGPEAATESTPEPPSIVEKRRSKPNDFTVEKGKAFIGDAVSRRPADAKTPESIASWIRVGFGDEHYAKYLEKAGKTLEEAVAEAMPKPKTPKPAGRPVEPGEVRGMYSEKYVDPNAVYDPGQVLKTTSGRQTSPFPKLTFGTKMKDRNSTQLVDDWLRTNAIDEAGARLDRNALRMFMGTSRKNMSPADRDSFEAYLFGEQSPVPKEILKPIKPAVDAVTEPPATEAERAPTAEDIEAAIEKEFDSREASKKDEPPSPPAKKKGLGKKKLKSVPGVDLNADPRTQAEQVAEYYRSQGKSAKIVNPRGSAQKAATRFAEELGVKLHWMETDVPVGGVGRPGVAVINTKAPTKNVLWGYVGHELAHATGIDKLRGVFSDDRVAESAGKYLNSVEKEFPKYGKSLRSDPDQLYREGVARLIQEFMENPEFRRSLKDSDRTTWDWIMEQLRKLLPILESDPEMEAARKVLRDMLPEAQQANEEKLFTREVPAWGKPTGIQPANLAKYLEKESKGTSRAFLKTAKETGYATDGRVMFRLTKADRKVIDDAKPEETGAVLGKDILEKSLRAGKGSSLAKVVGFRPASKLHGTPAYFAIEAEGTANVYAFNAKYVNTLRSRYPESVMLVTMNNDVPMLVLSDDGKRNGVLMGVNVDIKFRDEQQKNVEAPPTTKTVTDKRAEAKRKRDEALKKLVDAVKSPTLNVGVDANLVKLAVDLVLAEVELEVYSFAEFVQNVSRDVPELMDRLAPYLEAGWNVARKRDDRLGPSGKVADVLAADVDYGTAESPDRNKLGEYFGQRLIEGAKYDSIIQARKEAGDLVKGTIEPGRKAAKEVDEAVEIGTVRAAKKIIRDGDDRLAIYDQLVDLYERQPRLAVKTSTQMKDQAYSTPAPLAYLASELAQVDRDQVVYDSSAGNGMLLIGTDKPLGNELNIDRYNSLKHQGVQAINRDAVELKLHSPVPRLVINPPFGKVETDRQGVFKKFDAGGIKTDQVDHAITLNTLAQMTPDGKAAIIIGSKGFDKREPKPDQQRGPAYRKQKAFYDALYDRYNVVDHFTVHGDLYDRQGAAFPIDVIIVDGQGKSARVKPYNFLAGGLPEVFRSWEELKNAKLSKARLGTDERTVSGGAADGNIDVSGGVREEAGGSTTGNAENAPAGEPSVAGMERPTGSRPAGSRKGLGTTRRDQSVSGDTRRGTEERSDAGGAAVTGRPNGGVLPGTGDVVNVDIGEKQGLGENEFQTKYTPGSKQASVDTLLPANHVSAVERAMDKVREDYGDIDEFVANELQFSPEQMASAFSAEQVDAIALAIARHKEGAAFIIGDQTGVGKGRAAAAMLHYARNQGLIPVFLTEKPTLYADMIRDLTDIGLNTAGQPFNPLATNDLSGDGIIPLPDGRVLKQSSAKAKKLMEELANTKSLEIGGQRFDAVFTTYSQLSPVKQQLTARHAAMTAIAPNAFFVLDESHNAGGGSVEKDDSILKTSEIIRDIINESSGVYFSSATYAKRPQVMDLYAKTGMLSAVGGDPDRLADAISSGGVPLQQVVSEMLVESGAYLRRERSFDGIEFAPKVVDVDLTKADAASAVFKAIDIFDDSKEEAVKRMLDRINSSGGRRAKDSATGRRGIKSTDFSSIVWNLNNQMLLALKADAAADEAIASLEAGESPVLYVDSTMEEALKRQVESLGTQQGDRIDFSFRDLFQRYLDRSREVLIQMDAADPKSYVQQRMTDEDLGDESLELFNSAQRLIDGFDAEMPASPIDWIRKRLTDAGYRVAEITGRKNAIKYQGDSAYLDRRDVEEQGSLGKSKSVNGFNSGEIDALIINSSGATGISLHASSKFTNQKRRSMIIAQPSLNIDTFMQSLGRIHRTGQVAVRNGQNNLPRFALLMTNAPAENRPASVLVRKLASLNANVTASSKGAVGFDVPDVINKVGDQVVAEYIVDHPELAASLERKGVKVDPDRIPEEFAKYVTGRLSLMPVKVQQEFWDDIVADFDNRIEELNRLGQNPLHAGVVDLRAKTLEKIEVFAGDEGSANVFAQPAYIEKVVAKKSGKPLSTVEIGESLKEFYGKDFDVRSGSEWANAEAEALREQALGEVDRRIAGKKPEVVSAIKEEMNARYVDVRLKLRSFAPGTSVSVWERDEAGELIGITPGVVVKTAFRGKGSKLAGSKWLVEVAVASPDRLVRVPFSQLGTDKSYVHSNNEVMKDFSEFEKDQSSEEIRYIGTGNLLAGYATLGGQVAFFTDSEGTRRRGVLMPRSFNLGRWSDARPVSFDRASKALEFLRGGGYLFTPDGVVVATILRDDLILRAPKSRSRSGKYTTNASILAAAKGNEFVSVGNRTEMIIEDPATQEAVLQALIDFAALQATDDKQRAKAIVEQAMAAPPDSPPLDAASDPFSGDKPISKADIVTTWRRLFQVPILEGGFRKHDGKGRRRAGVYRYLEEVVRLDEPYLFDLTVASHEIAHHLDKRFSATKDMLEDLKQDDENRWVKVKSQLSALDYDQARGNVAEGFAELFRHYILGQSVAPEATAWLKEVLRSDPEMEEASIKAIEQSRQYRDQGFMDRARSIFGGVPKDLEWTEVVKQDLMKTFDRAYGKLVDRFHMVQQVSGEIQRRGGFRGGATLYELVMGFNGTAQAHAAQSVYEGVTTVSNVRRKLGEGLSHALSVLDDSEDYANAQAYALAKHVMTLPENYNAGISREDASKVLSWAKEDSDRHTRYEAFASRLTKFNNDLIEMLYDAGVIDVDARNRVLEAHGETYVPLLRESKSAKKRRTGSGSIVALPKALASRSQRGSDRPVQDLVYSTIMRTQRFVSQAMKQQVLIKLVESADPALGGAEGLGEFISYVDPKQVSTTGRVGEILDALVKEGFVAPEDARASKLRQKVENGGRLNSDDTAFLQLRYGVIGPTVDMMLSREPSVDAVVSLWRTDYRLENGKYRVRVNVRGTPRIYDLDPEFYASITSIDPVQMPLVFRVFRKFNSYFKAGSTAFSTSFGVQNFPRDIQTAFVNSKQTKGIGRIGRSVEWAAIYGQAMLYDMTGIGKSSATVALFKEFGGDLYSSIGSDQDRIRRVRQGLMKLSTRSKFVDALTKGTVTDRLVNTLSEFADIADGFMDSLRNVIAVSDVGPRLAEFSAAMESQGWKEKNGKLVDSAGNEEIPRDSVIRALVQAQDVTYNYRRVGSATQYWETIFPFTNAAIQSFDKTLRVYRDAIKDIRHKGMNGERARRVAWSMAMTTAAIVAYSMYRAGDDDKEEQKPWLWSYFTTGSDGVTKLKFGKSREHAWLGNLIAAIVEDQSLEDAKQVLKHEVADRVPTGGGLVPTLLETTANWNFFSQRKIEPDWTQGRPKELRFDDYTLETSKAMGMLAQQFPVARNLSPLQIEHLLDGTTGGAYRRMVGSVERAATGNLGSKDIPFVRGLKVDRIQKASIDDFYEQKNVIKQELARDKAYGRDQSDSQAAYDRFVDYEQLMTILRDFKSDSYDPTKNIVALSREALGRDPLASYPHPLYHQELPEEARAELLKTMVNKVRTVAEGTGMPKDLGRADLMQRWENDRNASGAFLREHSKSPIVREAIEFEMSQDRFQDLLRGKGAPKSNPVEMYRYRTKQAAAQGFVSGE
jgi:hypothetical protein